MGSFLRTRLSRLGSAALNVMSGVPLVGSAVVRSVDLAAARRRERELEEQLAAAHAEIRRLRQDLSKPNEFRMAREESLRRAHSNRTPFG